jgi:uncharacterized protein
VTVFQETKYPWEGRIVVRLELATPAEFVLKLRLPGWSENYSVALNSQVFSATPDTGYLQLSRTWQNGDELVLDLLMPVQRIYAHSKVTADRGRVALQRGPIVYCLEEVDNGQNLDSLLLPRAAELEYTYEPTLLGGVVTVQAAGIREDSEVTDSKDPAYLTKALPLQNFRLKAIPYFAWDNRAEGDMLVWIRESS